MVDAPRAGLGPGWIQLDELTSAGEDEDDFEEDEVEYIVLDMSSQLTRENLAAQTRIQLAGLDTATPFLRVGPRVFEGRYERLIGTEVIYQDASDPTLPPTLVAGTDQRIRFFPVHLKTRDPAADPSSLEVFTTTNSASNTKAKAKPVKPDTTAATASERGGRSRGRPKGNRGRGAGRGKGIA